MDAVEDIKSRLAIEDVIGEYVELKRAGRNFKGLSPFGAEKTPSFIVSPEKQIWHDFSSGKGGDMFSFVMEMEGLDFKGVLELLARKAGVELKQYRSDGYAKNTKLKERLYLVLDQASKFYQVHLKSNRDVLEYVLKDRALSKETVIEFRIGYAPADGRALTQYLTKQGFKTEEIKKAGLGNVYSGQFRDMFRNRMMIALMDSQGRVIGFTARILDNNPNAPKYINTPQTLLYDKSRHVFGLHLAKDAIRKQNFAVVVEGNMDVIASHQAGTKNVVATAGTAMTTQHLKEISRFSDDIRLSFDQDKAGIGATERTIALSASMDINLRVITIKGGKDPDELIKIDKESWQKAITKSTYAIDWLMDYYKYDLDLSSGAGKKSYAGKLIPIFDKLVSPVEKEHYKVLLSQKIGVSVGAVNQQTTKNTAKMLKKPKSSVAVSRANAEIIKAENRYLSIMLAQPSLRHYMNVATKAMFTNDVAGQMFELIYKNKSKKLKELDSLIKDVQFLGDYGKVIALLYEELYADLEFVVLEEEAARLQVRVIEHYVNARKLKITDKLRLSEDSEAQRDLLKKSMKLNELLKSAKETL